MGLSYEVVAENILHFPNALKNAKEMVEFFERTDSKILGDWQPWMSNGDDVPHEYGSLKHLTEQNSNLETNPDTKELALRIIGELYDTFNECFREYYKALGIDATTVETYIEQYKHDRPPHLAIKKYFIGEELGPHPDWGTDTVTAFTASAYFNDNYEGGELGFPDHGVAIKPTPGSIVLFPSTYMHESLPAYGSVKYVTNIVRLLPLDVITIGA